MAQYGQQGGYTSYPGHQQPQAQQGGFGGLGAGFQKLTTKVEGFVGGVTGQAAAQAPAARMQPINIAGNYMCGNNLLTIAQQGTRWTSTSHSGEQLQGTIDECQGAVAASNGDYAWVDVGTRTINWHKGQQWHARQ